MVDEVPGLDNLLELVKSGEGSSHDYVDPEVLLRLREDLREALLSADIDGRGVARLIRIALWWMVHGGEEDIDMDDVLLTVVAGQTGRAGAALKRYMDVAIAIGSAQRQSSRGKDES